MTYEEQGRAMRSGVRGTLFRWLAGGSASVLLLMVPGVAWSEPTAPRPERAERAIWAGRAARRPGGPSTDRGWASSLLGSPAVKPRQIKGLSEEGNLGITEAALRKYRGAAMHLAFALRTFPANGKPEHKKLLEQTLERVRQEVGALRIAVNVPGAEVLVDGESIGRAPLEGLVYVEAGGHRVEGKLAGYAGTGQQVTVEKGAEQDVSVAMTSTETVKAVAAPVRPVKDEPQGGADRRLVIGGGVTAGVLALVGGALSIVGASKKSEAASLLDTLRSSGNADPCAQEPSKCSAVREALRSHDQLDRASLGMFIGAGAAAVGTAAYGLLVSKKIDRPRVGLLPTLGAGNTGLMVWGAW